MTSLMKLLGSKSSIRGGPFGSKLTQADYRETGIPVIRGSNMGRDGRFIGGEFAFVSLEKYHSDLQPNTAYPGDIIITQRGTLGQVSIVPNSIGFPNLVISQSQMAITVPPEKADRDFLYYFFSSPFFQSYIEHHQIQTGVPHINLGLLRDVEFTWPEPSAQTAIGGVLSALDEKIELNRRMNETLEQMAQAVFKDWFVDFGPVRRKREGASDPIVIMGGLAQNAARAAELTALFPDAFGDDALPTSWRPARLDTMLELAYGKSLPKTSRTDGDIPVYGSGGINGWHHEALVSGPGIVVGRKGTVGSLFWVQSDFFAIDTVFYVRPKATYELNFVWFMLHRLGLQHMNTDAAVPGLNRENVYRLEFPAAPEIIRVQFASFAGLLRAKIESNRSESSRLTETRDYLLPKLMSGEVRVREAERMMEPSA